MPSEKNRGVENTSSAGYESGFFGKQTFTVSSGDTKELYHSEANSADSGFTSGVLGAAVTRVAQRAISLTVNVGLSNEEQLIRETNRILAGEQPPRSVRESR